MKRLFLLLASVLLFAQVYAYEFDVILTKERKQFQCFILNETDNQVVYILNDNDATQYTINKTDILKIYYADQEKKTDDIATTAEVLISNQSTGSVAPAASEPVAENIVIENSATIEKPQESTQINLAHVAKVNGLYVFTDSDPVADYEVLGEIEIGSASEYSHSLFSLGQYTEVRDALIEKSLRANHKVEAVLLTFVTGGVDKAVLIRFKDPSADRSLATVRRYQGIYVFTDAEPIAKYDFLGVLKAKTTLFFPQYTFFRDGFVEKCNKTKKYKGSVNAIIVKLVHGGKDTAEAIRLK